MTSLRCPRCGTLFQPPARFCTRDGFPLVTQAAGAAPPESPSKGFELHRTGEASAAARPGDPASGLRGRVLDSRYAIEARVGEGGMAYVYRATDLQTQQTVAVKVLMSRLAGDTESNARLRREAQFAMRLRHPNVCGLLAFGDAGGMPYLVMPYLEGETLSTRESRVGPMPPEDAIPILVELCHGLQHAHDAGVLHRDLKPENVMLVPWKPDAGGAGGGGGGGERAVLMDFGLAKERMVGADVAKLTATGIVLGTPEFMSPEQIRGKPLDPRSDVYSLGVLAFELLTGELPFEGATAQETMLNHLTGRPRKLRAVHPELPGQLESIISRALALSPPERFASMREFGEALAKTGGR